MCQDRIVINLGNVCALVCLQSTRNVVEFDELAVELLEVCMHEAIVEFVCLRYVASLKVRYSTY